MSKTDPQLKSNDCGISVVKTIYNIFNIDINRKFIEETITLDENGSRLIDLKLFFDTNNCEANYRLLDINYIQGNKSSLDELFPFIIPIHNKTGLHYVVANGRKGNKIVVFDPEKGSNYNISILELKKNAYFSKNYWDLVETDEKIAALCSQELLEYKINYQEVSLDNDNPTLFNKLTYFSYLKENFGFKNKTAEKDFVLDLLKNQQISSVPKHFRSLKYSNDQVKITAPIILTVKSKKENPKLVLPKSENENVYWLLLKQLGQFKKLWYIYIFAALFSASTAQLSVFVSQILIDNVLPSYNINTLIIFAIGVGVYRLFDLSTSIYKSFVGIHLGNLMDNYFLQSFDKKINSFSLPYINSYRKGDLIERVSDSLKLKSFFLRFFTSILVDVCVSIYSLGLLFYINWKIALIVLVVMFLFFTWFKIITPYLKQNERIRYISKADFLSKIIEKIEGIQVIKSFKIEQFHSDKINLGITSYLKIQLKNGYIDLLNKVVVSIIIIASSVLIMVYLTKTAILDHSISLGQIVTFIGLSSMIFSSLRSILDENLTLQENEVILKRNLDFDEPQRPSAGKGIKDFEIEKVEIQNLNFGYYLDQPILKDINLEFSKGQKIKIEGHNGSGKSTLSKILTGLYYPNSGEILINDSINKLYDPEKIKDKILLVTNEDILFNDTLEGNICLGKDIDRSIIIEHAKKIDFYDFIAQKEEALDFMVNENGKNLSTGQRKKILLLRALLSNAEVLILDEVLSGMDFESRYKVEQMIQLDTKRTYIIISHEPIINIHFTKKYKIINGELSLI
jgi:ATP-binding cassette, subfamily B, bacterial HlyB/CyaB